MNARCRHAVLAVSAVLGATACDITKPLPPAVLVSPASLTLEDGQSEHISAKLRNAKPLTVHWSTSNPAVATVDITGTVSGVSNGTANIIVRWTQDTTVMATIPVTVAGPAVATVTLTPSAATVYVGTSRQIAARLRSADGRPIVGRTVTWSTPDASIADVSTAGVVRGRGPGGPIALVATSEGHSATTQIRVAYAAELCPFATPITLGQRVDGRLALGDCEFSLDGSYVDVYEFTLTAPATVQIDMTSTEIDSYLGFFDGAGVFLAEDDNSGGGKNAQLVQQLAAGKYRIWANAFGPDSGAYSLIVTQR